ncbi:MAG: hypothetical protein EOP83_21585 [Verrucomicrobiaceae bacterium]|nr:MAG: hypothetical protein EOP83_21585 [Verrucomicrobiaceae bacterium]
MQDCVKLSITGHVLIRDPETLEVFVDKNNHVHYENMSEALALSLANRSAGSIYEMVFGNGASTVSGTGAITYFPPNVKGQDARLYNQTYAKVVDDMSPLVSDNTKNYLRVQHKLNTTYSDIIVTAYLSFNEPDGQELFDDATNNDGSFVFDELGLKSFDPSENNGKLLTHVVFHPVQKALNRTIEIIYTLRIQMN